MENGTQGFDDRILQVSIEINGKFKIYKGLQITAKGEKKANSLENSCSVVIFNLTKEHRNYLLTETSPFNKNRTRKMIKVEAGRESTGLSTVFMGDIISAEPSMPPDIGLSLELKTGSFQKGNLVARSGKAHDNISELSKQIASDAGLKLDFQATDKSVSSYSYTGGALGQVEKLGEMGNINAFVDDNTLIVKDRNKPRTNKIKILNKNSGLIEVPKVTEHGIKCKFLYDNETVVGGLIRLKSELNPSLDGDYEIYKLNFDLTVFDNAWYYEAEAKRLS